MPLSLMEYATHADKSEAVVIAVDTKLPPNNRYTPRNTVARINGGDNSRLILEATYGPSATQTQVGDYAVATSYVLLRPTSPGKKENILAIYPARRAGHVLIVNINASAETGRLVAAEVDTGKDQMTFLNGARVPADLVDAREAYVNFSISVFAKPWSDRELNHPSVRALEVDPLAVAIIERADAVAKSFHVELPVTGKTL